MNDLVKDLLFRASDQDGIGRTPTTVVPVPAGLLHRAADEIERLRAALEDVSSTFDDTYSPYSREGRLGRLARAALAEEKKDDR